MKNLITFIVFSGFFWSLTVEVLAQADNLTSLIPKISRPVNGSGMQSSGYSSIGAFTVSWQVEGKVPAGLISTNGL